MGENIFDVLKRTQATTLDVSKQRSPFNHHLFFCTLCTLHKESRLSKRMMQKVLDFAFMQPADKIDLDKAAKEGRITGRAAGQDSPHPGRPQLQGVQCCWLLSIG